MESKRRIGMLGGSFDPPHVGHFICARYAAEFLDLEKVLVVPARLQPFKPEGAVASPEARWEMLEAAVGMDVLFELSDVEYRREKPSFTVDTLEELRKTYPLEQFEIYCLMGLDTLAEISGWQLPHRLFQLARVGAMGRNGISAPDLSPEWKKRTVFVPTPRIEIASTDIRRRLERRLPVDFLVSKPVADVIRRLALYRCDG